MAPRARSSHMNQKRSCPGVPNRYRTSSASRVMRPKSIATVVVVLPVTRRASSTSTPADVMAPSVTRGVISDTAPTNVVLPTPKPPATTILTGTGRRGATAADRSCWMSDGAETMENPLEQDDAGSLIAGTAVHADQSLERQVRDEDP